MGLVADNVLFSWGWLAGPLQQGWTIPEPTIGPFHLSGPDCHMLDVSAVPPGLFAGTSYEMHTLQLEPGDSVLFCTDGLTEAFDRHGEQFGHDRLRALCRTHCSHSRSRLLDCVFQAVAGFSGPGEIQDDMAATLFHLDG